jgi:ubiquitin carboxyl-terminal hydrolase 5/13
MSCLHWHVQDMAAQLAKVSRALAMGLTGRAPPAVTSSTAMNTDQPAAAQEAEDDSARANAVRPYMFKSIVGKGHAEFSSGRCESVNLLVLCESP